MSLEDDAVVLEYAHGFLTKRSFKPKEKVFFDAAPLASGVYSDIYRLDFTSFNKIILEPSIVGSGIIATRFNFEFSQNGNPTGFWYSSADDYRLELNLASPVGIAAAILRMEDPWRFFRFKTSQQAGSIAQMKVEARY